MNDLLPAENLFRIFQVFNSRKVMLVLLHSGDPRDIVECDDFEAKVLVVANLLYFTKEGGEVGCGNIVNMGQEICWRKLLMLV
jgi:hypothetical protein